MRNDKQVNVVDVVNEFFTSVYNYTGKVYDAYVDEGDKKQVDNAIGCVRKVEEQLKELYNANRNQKYDLSQKIFTTGCGLAFVKPGQLNTNSNATWKMRGLFDKIVSVIGDYYYSVGSYSYVDSSNVLKSINKWNKKASKVKKIKPQMDIDAVVARFFDSAYKYANKNALLYTDKNCFGIIQHELGSISAKKVQCQQIRMIQDGNQSEQFANNILYTNSDFQYVFHTPNSQKDISRVFMDTVQQIVAYYKGRDSKFDRDPQELLVAIKKWYYTISSSVFKDYVYPFLPATHFAKQPKGR